MEKVNNNLIIGWLYPELMSTYGDQGNIRVLRDRARARGIATEVRPISLDSSAEEIAKADLLFIGGAQDQSQKIVAEDLSAKKEVLQNAIEKGVPGLYVCGAYQLLGQYYEISGQAKIPGLGIFACHTKNPGTGKRMIGNIILETNILELKDCLVIGFENHGGETFLEGNAKPLGTVVRGFGNNGQDGAEGIVHKNSIGTYLHGPILPKNPELADWLIGKAYEVKYGLPLLLSELDDKFEDNARAALLKRTGVSGR